MTNLDSPQGRPGPAGTPGPPPETTQTPPVTGSAEPARPLYQPGTARYPGFDPQGTVYAGSSRTAPTERHSTDWATRNQQSPGRTEFIDPDAPVRGRARLVGDRGRLPDRDHLIDTEERLAVGDESGYDYPEEQYEEPVRVSWLAVLGLVLGVVGILAALTGVLAPVGFAAGTIGLLASVGGLVATRHRHVASRPLAGFAFLASAGAVVLGWLAIYGGYEWLNRDDQAGWLRDWLNARFPWLESW